MPTFDTELFREKVAQLRKEWDLCPTPHAEQFRALIKKMRDYHEKVINDPNAVVKPKDKRFREWYEL